MVASPPRDEVRQEEGDTAADRFLLPRVRER